MLVGNYFAYDSIGALAPLMIEGMGIGREQIGMLYSFYSWPNVIMVFIGGFLIDRLGTRVMSLVFSALIVLGASLVALAPLFWLMLAGRVIFGIGAESLIVCQSAILAKWFKGRELAFAFGLSLTFMRLGTLFSFNTEAWIAEQFQSWRIALWVAAALCGFSLVSNLVYVYLEQRARGRVVLSEGAAGDKIVLADVKQFNRSYWFVTALCVTFYSAIFPFTAFSTDFFHDKWGYPVMTAGRITSIVIFASMILSPILGRAVDRIGRRGTMMMVGAVLLIPCYLTMGLTTLSPLAPMALIGFAFSLVPAALWPAVPLIVEPKNVGTAFGLMTMIQNIGLATFPWLVGWLRDVTHTYTGGMVVFAGLGVVGFVFAILLKRADAQAGGGLERP
ncbi:MAG: MFS transporter [Acidobacteria bacterium]|nr:MFS transporter [Acidobacteriota bacterium]